jgi:hypothetical protein
MVVDYPRRVVKVQDIMSSMSSVIAFKIRLPLGPTEHNTR